MTRPWPIATDRTPLDRARTIARGLLAELVAADPAAAERAVTVATRFGETWLTGRPAVDVDEQLSVADVAYLAGVRPKAVYEWGTRGIVRDGEVIRLTRQPEGGYDPDDVTEFLALRRATRKLRRKERQ